MDCDLTFEEQMDKILKTFYKDEEKEVEHITEDLKQMMVYSSDTDSHNSLTEPEESGPDFLDLSGLSLSSVIEKEVEMPFLPFNLVAMPPSSGTPFAQIGVLYEECLPNDYRSETINEGLNDKRNPIITTTIELSSDISETSLSSDESESEAEQTDRWADSGSETDVVKECTKVLRNDLVKNWLNSVNKYGKPKEIKRIKKDKKRKVSKESRKKKNVNYRMNLKIKPDRELVKIKRATQRLRNRTHNLMIKGVKKGKEAALKAEKWAPMKDDIPVNRGQYIEVRHQLTEERQEQRKFQRRAQETAKHYFAFKYLQDHPKAGVNLKDIPKLNDEQSKNLALKLFCEKKYK